MSDAPNTKFDHYLKRKMLEYGQQFNSADLDIRFIAYFNSRERIKVETCGVILTGTVGVTTGWKPCFLLMRSKRSSGSAWTLGPNDKILAVKRRKRYKI